MFDPSEVISDEYPAGFAIDSLIIFAALRVIRRHAGEAKVDGQALVRLCCHTSHVC